MKTLNLLFCALFVGVTFAQTSNADFVGDWEGTLTINGNETPNVVMQFSASAGAFGQSSFGDNTWTENTNYHVNSEFSRRFYNFESNGAVGSNQLTLTWCTGNIAGTNQCAGTDNRVYTVSNFDAETRSMTLTNDIGGVYQFGEPLSTDQFNQSQTALHLIVKGNQLMWTLNQNPVAYKIYNVNGSLVANSSLQTGNQNSINIAALSKGVYLAEFETENGQRAIAKFIK